MPARLFPLPLHHGALSPLTRLPWQRGALCRDLKPKPRHPLALPLQAPARMAGFMSLGLPVMRLRRIPQVQAWERNKHTSADPRDGESRGEWYGCGPPAQVRSPTNSWLYVPLLHAALGALTDGALAQWRADPRAAPWWEEARRALAASAPVPVAALTEALIAAAVHNHEALPQTALAEAATLPPSTLIHLGWVVRHLVGEDGYITAAGQAVCLETFGGAGFATALDRRSDIFRHARRLTVTYGAIEPPL